MFGLQARALILLALLAASTWMLTVMRPGLQTEADPHWPNDELLYTVPGWQVEPPSVEATNGNVYVTRIYRRPDGLTTTFVITTSSTAKRIYRAGPEVPLLGSGYSVTDVAGQLVPVSSQATALLARSNDQNWLQLSAYGEQRGLLGNGVLPWALVIADAILGRPNEYYMLRLLLPLDPSDPVAEQHADQAAQLAKTLFERVARWYAS
jgi:hypothetical protein